MTRNNYRTLFEGLQIFRNAMLPFLVEQLRGAYGEKEWWNAGVRRALGSTVCEELEANYQKRYDKTMPVVTRTGSELWEMLDVNRFLPIIEANWKGPFSKVFKQRDQITVWLREVNDVRNIVAHPETGDIAEQDAWRALDTMERFLRAVNANAAEQIAELRERVTGGESEQSPWRGLRDGPLDYGRGLEKLAGVIQKREGNLSDAYVTFVGKGRQLVLVYDQLKIVPGAQIDKLRFDKESILNEMERLAQQYLGLNFTELCHVTPIPEKPEDSLIRIRELREEVKRLENELYKKVQLKLLQQNTGETVASLEREISRITSELEHKQLELEHLEEEGTPSAFFTVKRRTEPNGDYVFVEEQSFEVTVTVTNLGRKATEMEYKEELPEGITVTSGETELRALAGPGAHHSFSYTCFATCPGKHFILSGQLSYQGRSVWDQLQETVVEVRPGTPPQLTARRYYRYEADGLKLLVRIDNKGDRTARDVCYEEEIFVKGEPQPVRLTFRGDLPGAEVGQIIEHRLNVNDHTLILIPERSEITYRDSRGKRESIALDPVLKRIEYDFPQTPTSTRLVGRDEEVLRITDFIHQIVQAQRNRSASNLKRLLFIEGIEGAGKTRLVHELSRQAEGSGFRCFLEDGKDRSPVKRMLRRLLGLRPDEDTDRIIWDRLKEHFDKEQNPQREVVYQLISTVPTRLEQDGLDSLAAGVLVLIKKLCKGWPTLLVFENIQWIPEGLEEQLIIRLFQDTLSSTGEPILLCATYRPMHTGAPPTVSKLKMSSDRYETIRLGAISEKAARALVDQIVTFPKLSEPLYDFVLKWSHNNPLYLIEILRLLLQPDSAYITRVGGVWHPAPGTRLEEAVPESIEKVILARVEQELPSEMEFLKVLSAIGFELPLALVEGLIHTEFPEWSSNELYTHLELLVKAGLLAKQSRDAAASGDYEFEHHIKREVLYQTLPEGMRSHLSERVAEILLSQTIFSDPDEQARQLARHLVKSRRQFREAHLEEIVKAAELERDMCNFSKSLQFYDAALELLPESGSRQGSHNTHKLVTLLLERSRLNQMRGYLIPAERDLEQAHDLLSRHRNSAKSRDPQAKRLSIKVDKERGRVMSKQPHAILERANEFLYRARVGMEGILRLRRFFPPKDKEFYQDLVEIYLALAEIWLRKRDFKVCRRICKRAARLAEKAKTSLRYESLLPLVYLTLGDIYREWGREERDHTRARKWYNDALKRVGSNLYQQERIRVALADVACALNDSVGALRQYEEAIRIQNQIGDAYGLAMSFGGVGGLLVEQENYEEGRYYCEEAYKYQQLIGDLGRFWRTCYSLTKIYCHKKEWEKAIEYWSQARPVLFGQHRFSRLSSKERGDIYNLVCELADYFRKNNRLEEHLMFAQDKEEAAPSNDRNELAGVRIEIGEASFKVRDWPAAVAAFTEALELTNTAMVRAEIYEWLGDIYTVYDTPARAVSADDSNNLKGQAESCYEKAVTQLICINNIPRALAAYRKLLRQVMTDEAGMWQFPLTFLHILQVTPFSIGVHDQFVEETLDLLLKNEKPGEAGDILVYTARIAAREDDAVIPREKKLYYLERAEETYRLGSKEDLIWGLNMLIPSYFRIELWDSIIRCFEELFELYFEVEGSKVEDILGTFKAISVFKDAITPDQLEHFIALALDGPKRIAFTSSEEKHLFLYVAKTYSHIAYKVVAEEARRNEDLALEYFDKARASASPDDPLITTVLNDSALIYEHRGEHEEALKRLDEAILMHKQFGLSSAGACYCNRAMIYIDLGRRKEARDDFEQALEYESKDSEHWDARLKNQDERPLSLAEIRQMHHDKESLGITCRSFANLLLGEGEDLEMAHELALRAKRLFEEINRPDAAKAAGFIGDLTEVMVSDGSLVEKLIELRGRLHTSEFLQPLNESGYVCPSCQLPLDTGVVSVRCPNCAQQFCSECKSVVGDGAPECSECGQALCSECGFKVHGEDEKCFARQTLLPSCCVKCGSNIDPDHAQCPQCGGSFNAGDVTVISI